MREDVDEAEMGPVAGPEYPRTVRIAGFVWIFFGGLVLLGAALSLVMTAVVASGRAPEAAGGVCAVVFALFIGGVFVFVGIQSVQGTARDTLGNGIGSLIFGLIYLGYGVVMVLGGVAAAGTGLPGGAVLAIFGGVFVLGGAGLLAAGVLALVGRQDYKAWRRAQRSRTPGKRA
jgi:hypothetical protein